MKQIMKSQLYQIRTDKFFIIAILGVVWVMWDMWNMCLQNMRENVGNLGGLYGSAAVVENASEYLCGLLYLTFVLAVVMGKDYADKTVNYDVLAGYSKKQAFWGRLATAVLIGGSILLITTFIRVIFYTVRYGWGDILDGTQYIACVGVCLLVFYRVIGELTLLTVATKRYWVTLFAAAVIGYGEYLAAMVLRFSESEHDAIWFLSIPAIDRFLYPKEVFEFQGNAEVASSWIQMPETYVVAGTIILSIVIGTGCLFAGSRLTGKRDMD